MEKILISVVMSIYNEEEEWIKDSINSILKQTYDFFELIIINDNPESKLNTKVLDLYNDERLVLITNEKNIGLTKSLNKGLSQAKGKYIARMDADDIANQDRLISQLNYMESHPNCVVCGSVVEVFGLKNKKFYGVFENDDENKLQLFLGPCFAHPVTMIRHTTLIQNKIKYNEECRFSQDYMLWVDLSNLGEFHNIQYPLLKYRFSNQQISTLRLNEQTKIAIKIRKKYIEKFLNLLCDDTDFCLPNILTKEILWEINRIESNIKEFNHLQRDAFHQIYFVTMSSMNIKNLLFVICFSLKHKFSLKDILKIIRNVLCGRNYL